jgi:NAD(P)H-hydrate epimerase
VKRALTVAEMGLAEAGAAQLGVSTSALMENAGVALAGAAQRLALPSGRVFVICGPGSNGGDGLVAARHLASARRAVYVDVVGSAGALKGDAAHNLALLEAAAPESFQSLDSWRPGLGDVVVDALFGTGLSRAPEGRFSSVIERLAHWRTCGAKVVAADVPSGMNSDTGGVFSSAVFADETVTFGALKRGQLLEPGASHCGHIQVVDIGIPKVALDRLPGPITALVEESEILRALPARDRSSHKGSFGHVLVIAGSPGKTGAAALSAVGALRAGAGLVTIAARTSVLAATLRFAPELMGVSLGEDGPLGRADVRDLAEAAKGKAAVVVGPGLWVGAETRVLLEALLEEVDAPMVLDADGLNLVAGRLDVLRQAKSPLLLTPHPGELARLMGITAAEVQSDRLGLAHRCAKEARACVLLKGARSIIALPDGTSFVNPTGNPGMATGGTGDVLSGVCAALMAQGLSPADAAMVGAFAHGRAGDVMALETGETGLIASDLFTGLGRVWRALGR